MRTLCFGVLGGIGDVLFITPTLRLIKKHYPDIKLHIVSREPAIHILENNPYVDKVTDVHKDKAAQGFLIRYPDPLVSEQPVRHHIHTAWRQMCGMGKLSLPLAPLQPEIYLPISSEKVGVVGVQAYTKRSHTGDAEWRDKKRWPYAHELMNKSGYEPIKIQPTIAAWVYELSKYKLIVCNEGGVSHLAKALNIPAIVIFGGYSKPTWNGYPDQYSIRTVPTCQGCYNEKPCDFRCMLGISVDYVQKVVEEVLNGRSS